MERGRGRSADLGEDHRRLRGVDREHLAVLLRGRVDDRRRRGAPRPLPARLRPSPSRPLPSAVRSTTLTVAASSLDTKSRRPSLLTASCSGSVPTGHHLEQLQACARPPRRCRRPIDRAEAGVFSSTPGRRDTGSRSGRRRATLPSGLRRTPRGRLPSGTVATTCLGGEVDDAQVAGALVGDVEARAGARGQTAPASRGAALLPGTGGERAQRGRSKRRQPGPTRTPTRATRAPASRTRSTSSLPRPACPRPCTRIR